MNKQILKGIIFSGLFLVPFVPFLVSSSFFFPFITTKAFAWRIIVEIIFAAWVLLALAYREYRPKKSYLSYAVLAFIIIIGLADAFGVAPVKSFWSNAERMEGFVSLLHLGMFFIVISSFFGEIDWRRWWSTNLAAGFLMVIYSLFQIAGALEIHQGGARVDGTLGNAAYLAVYMLFNIFLALLLLIRENKRSIRWVYALAALSYAWILYFTATRGAILGLLLGLLIIALLNLRNKENLLLKRFSALYLAIFVLLIGGFFAFRTSSFFQSSPVLSRFANISPAELQGEGRSFVWPMAVSGVKERPILGWGQDNFNYVFNKHYSPEMFKLEQWFDRAHNIFLDWAIAGGVLGLLAYLSLYVLLLFYIWKRGTLAYGEKSILTGLIAAYFFHNFFVFDNLISYIFFFSLLAYIHSQTTRVIEARSEENEKNILTALPAVLILLILSLYFINIQPIIANTSLISALQNLQGGNAEASIPLFKKAYEESRLGRPEIVEQIATNAPTVLSSSISTEEKNQFFTFARDAALRQAEELSTDTRYQLLAGTFLTTTGQFDQALVYLDRARALSPGKQIIYFEIASAELNKGDKEKALATLKEAYDLEPHYPDAEIAYLATAIMVGNHEIETTLKAQLTREDPSLLLDDRIASAYFSTGRYNDLIELLKQKISENPESQDGYITLAAAYLKIGDKADAIRTLKLLEEKIPSAKGEAENYISGIESGAIK